MRATLRYDARGMPRPPALILPPAARDAAIERLQDHYARDDLDVEQFERRVLAAENATTTAQLQDALAGLPAPPGSAAQAALVPVERSGQLTTTVSALLSSTERRGPWRVPSRLVVKATLGNVELDLSEAQIDGEVDLQVSATFGSVRIIVPEGLALDVDGRAVLGSFEHLAQHARSRRDRRLLRVRGRALFGSVELRVKRQGTGLLTRLKRLLEG